MVRRWPAVAACMLLLAAGGCRGGPPAPAAPPPTSVGGTAGAGASGYGPPATLGILSDPDVAESSGLVASRRNPGVLWTHNDSGDGAYLYCLDARIKSCGVWRVTGAQAFDWEDIAAGPGPYLYVGDIGDNLAQRGEIVVYRVPEPVAGPADGPLPVPTRAAPAATAPAEALRLRYPDGPRDAEALLVHPSTGDLYVVAKRAASATVYRAAAPFDPAVVTTLSPVATVRLGGGLSPLDDVTGGDIAPDGRRVALSTYGSGYELELPAGEDRFDAIWGRRPTPVTLGPRLQGESIAYRLDGRALLSTSEKVPSPVQQVERR